MALRRWAVSPVARSSAAAWSAHGTAPSALERRPARRAGAARASTRRFEPAQPGAVGELGAGRLEVVGRVLVVGERDREAHVDVGVRAGQAGGAGGAGERPRLALDLGALGQRRRERRRLVGPTEVHQRLDHLRRGREVDVDEAEVGRAAASSARYRSSARLGAARGRARARRAPSSPTPGRSRGGARAASARASVGVRPARVDVARAAPRARRARRGRRRGRWPGRPRARARSPRCSRRRRRPSGRSSPGRGRRRTAGAAGRRCRCGVRAWATTAGMTSRPTALSRRYSGPTTSHGASCGSVEEGVRLGHGRAQQVGPAAPGEDAGRPRSPSCPTQRARAVRGLEAVDRAAARRGRGDVAGELAGQDRRRRAARRPRRGPRRPPRTRRDAARRAPARPTRCGRRRRRPARRRGRAGPASAAAPAARLEQVASRASGGPARQALSAAETSRRRGRRGPASGAPARSNPAAATACAPRARARVGGLVEHGRDARRPGSPSPRRGATRGGRRRRRGPPARARAWTARRVAGGGLRVDAGADQVVPERDAAGADGEQPRLRRLVEVGDARRRAARTRRSIDGEVAAGGRRDEQRGPRLGGERVRAARERPGERGGTGTGAPGGRASTPSSVSSSSASGLPPVAASSRARAVVGEPAAERARERRRVGRAEAADREHRQPGRADHRRRLVADGEQDHDRVGGEPPGREAQRLRRRRVEQVRVVDEHRERPVLGRRGSAG